MRIGNTFSPVCLSLSMSVCSRYIPFGPLKVGTSFLVYTNILVISRSDLSSKVLGQGQMNYISHYTYLYSTEACSEGQGQVKVGSRIFNVKVISRSNDKTSCLFEMLSWCLRVRSHFKFIITYFWWLPELNSSRISSRLINRCGCTLRADGWFLLKIILRYFFCFHSTCCNVNKPSLLIKWTFLLKETLCKNLPLLFTYPFEAINCCTWKSQCESTTSVVKHDVPYKQG